MQRLALVTGANQGLGLETCRQLARRGIHVVLTSRNEEKGKAAAQTLSSEGLTISYHPLDVSKSESIRALVHWLEKAHGRCDILVNNAGVLLDSAVDADWGSDETSALRVPTKVLRETMETNVYGPYELIQRIAPLMQKHRYGRIVNVSSGMGQLSEMGGGYPAYRMSKAALNVLTRVFSNELQGSGILLNSLSPGWVKTRMGGAEAPLPVEKGVQTIVWLATLSDDGPTGGFFDEDQDPMTW